MKRIILILCALSCVVFFNRAAAQIVSADLSVGSNFHPSRPFYRHNQSLTIALPKRKLNSIGVGRVKRKNTGSHKRIKLIVGTSKLTRKGTGPDGVCKNCYFTELNLPFTNHRLDERMTSIYTLVGKSFALNQSNSLRIMGSAGPSLDFHSIIEDYRFSTTTNSYSGAVTVYPETYRWDREKRRKIGLNTALRVEWAPLNWVGLFLGGQWQVNSLLSSHTLNLGVVIGNLLGTPVPRRGPRRFHF